MRRAKNNLRLGFKSPDLMISKFSIVFKIGVSLD